MHKNDVGGEQLEGWLAGTKWVELNAESKSWEQSNYESILAKQEKYLPAWNKKAERPALRPEDGV